MGLVAGVVALNALLTAVGYGLLALPLRGRGIGVRASYAGVALLVGSAVVGVVLQALATVGVRTGVASLLVVSALVACGGLAATRLRSGRLDARPLSSGPPRSRLADAVATAAAAAIVALLVLVLVGGFRAAPWLDDTWFFWLPKGIALDTLGLDPRLFAPNDLAWAFDGSREPLYFVRPDNPLWWSILIALDVRFVGSIDLRAVNGELAFLTVAFVAAAARLLWGRVRPWILFPALLLVLAAPEFLRQAQGGDADVPLAIYLGLGLLAVAGWLLYEQGFLLALALVFEAAAVAIKSEGAPELVLYLAILSLAASRRSSRYAQALAWASAAGAIVASAPWFAWRAAHGVSNVFSLRNALDPSYLSKRTEVLRGSAETLGGHFLSVREWSLIVPACALLAVAAALRERRPAWLAPALVPLAGYVFFVWVTWADPEGAFRIVASAYRYVTPPIVVAGLCIPVLGERLALTLRPLGRRMPTASSLET